MVKRRVVLAMVCGVALLAGQGLAMPQQVGAPRGAALFSVAPLDPTSPDANPGMVIIVVRGS